MDATEELGSPENEELHQIERDLERRREMALVGELPDAPRRPVRGGVAVRRRRAPDYEDFSDPSSAATSDGESYEDLRSAIRVRMAPQPPAQRRRRRVEEAEEVGQDEAEAEERAAAAAAPAAPPPPPMGAGGRRIAPDIQKVLDVLGLPQPASECFGCTHGREDSASIAYEPYRKMEELFQSKLSTSDEIQLAQVLASYFENAVRKRANANRREGEEPICEWKASTIYFHFRCHIDDFSIKRHGRIRMMENLIYRQYVFKCWTSEIIDGGEEAVPDSAGWKTLKDMLNTEARLYGQNPRTAMFSTSGVGMASDEARPLVNMSKRRMYSRNAARFTGTSISARSANAGVGGTVQGAGAKRGGGGSGF